MNRFISWTENKNQIYCTKIVVIIESNDRVRQCHMPEERLLNSLRPSVFLYA